MRVLVDELVITIVSSEHKSGRSRIYKNDFFGMFGCDD